MKNLNKNYLIYGCSSKEEYNLIKTQKDEFNYKVWRIISLIALCYFLFLIASTFSVEVVKVNAAVYLIMAIVALGAYVLLRTSAKPGTRQLLLVVHGMCLALLWFGIMIGAILSPVYLAVTYHVLMIALPLFIVDKPYRMAAMELLSTVVFVIACVITKTGATRDLDIFNAVTFCFLGILMNYYMVNTRIYLFLTSRKVQVSSVTDELTGLKNRKAYEADMQAFREDGLARGFVYVVMDVNGLKKVNDDKGHDAGDELLRGAADCIRNAFSNYGTVYRVGGDEFVAMIHATDEEVESIRKRFDEEQHNWSSSLVEELAVSVGFAGAEEFPEKDISELAKAADKRMYEDKAGYYRRSGMDRRGQQAAHKALCEMYTKILKVNLTDDSYRIINMDLEEQDPEKGFANTFSEWCKGFAANGQVYPDDEKDFLAQTDIEYLKECFRGDRNSVVVAYRRMIKGVYKRVFLEMIPADDYTDERQTLFLYVKSIDK